MTTKDIKTAAHPGVSLAMFAVLTMRFTCISLGSVDVEMGMEN